MIQEPGEESFEYWFYTVATEGERELTIHEQTNAHQLWLMQEANWAATAEGLDDYEEFGTPPSFR